MNIARALKYCIEQDHYEEAEKELNEVIEKRIEEICYKEIEARVSTLFTEKGNILCRNDYDILQWKGKNSDFISKCPVFAPRFHNGILLNNLPEKAIKLIKEDMGFSWLRDFREIPEDRDWYPKIGEHVYRWRQGWKKERPVSIGVFQGLGLCKKSFKVGECTMWDRVAKFSKDDGIIRIKDMRGKSDTLNIGSFQLL